MGFGVFLIDIGVMQGLMLAGVSPLAARAVSIPFAMFCAWQLNRRFTFAASGRSHADEGTRYAAVAIAAALVNYGVFAAIVSLIAPPIPYLAPYWESLAAMVGVAVSMWVSFFGLQAFAFSEKR